MVRNFMEENLHSTMDWKKQKQIQAEQFALFDDPSREMLYQRAQEQASGPELSKFVQEGVPSENMYSKESIEHDQQLLTSITDPAKQRISYSDRKKQQELIQKEAIFKAVLVQLIREKAFGENISVSIPSRYDAETTKIPLVIHISTNAKPHDPSTPHAPEQKIMLGIIPSFSDENDKELSISARVDKLLLRVEQNNLARMKYYEDPATGEKHPLMQLPAVMISRKTEKMLPLINAWNKKVAPDLKVLQAFKEDIFEQILTQLSYYPEYAKFYDRAPIAEKYTQIREALNPIIAEDADWREAKRRLSPVKTATELKSAIVYRG